MKKSSSKKNENPIIISMLKILMFFQIMIIVGFIGIIIIDGISYKGQTKCSQAFNCRDCKNGKCTCTYYVDGDPDAPSTVICPDSHYE